MRRVLVFAACVVIAASPAFADDELTIASISTQVTGSTPAGSQATAKVGDIVYWEDERTAPVAIVERELDEGSSFFGDKRALAKGARLRRARFGERDLYCATDKYALQRTKNAVLCLVDADGDKAFETTKLLGVSRASKPGHILINNDSSDQLKQPLPYRVEDGYPSVAGLRAVIRYRGEKDGKLVLGCAVEPKGEPPAGLKRMMFDRPGGAKEREQQFALPAGAAVDVAVPLCVQNDAFDFLRELGKQDQFVDPHTQGERPVALQITRADAQSIAFRITRPFARWAVWYDEDEDGNGSTTFMQEEK